MGGWMDGWIVERRDGSVDGWMDGWIDGWTIWMDGRTDGRMDGRGRDGRVVGRTNRCLKDKVIGKSTLNCKHAKLQLLQIDFPHFEFTLFKIGSVL